MRKPIWTPSIVPAGDNDTVYLVKDDLGCLGAVWREADGETTDLETVITDLLTGQYKDPVRVVASTPRSDGRRTYPRTSPMSCAAAGDIQMRDVPSSVQDFVEGHEGHHRQLALHLV